MALAIVIVGFAVSLSIFFLVESLLRMRPAFDQATVMRLGHVTAGLSFALCGPVLVLREGLLPRRNGNSPRWPLTSIVFAVFWAGLVGVFALETGRLFVGA